MNDTSRRVRRLAAISLGFGILTLVLIKLGWDQLQFIHAVPAIGAAAVLAWPIRPVVWTAVIVNALYVVLGLMTAGILYGFSLVPLILALGHLRPSPAPEVAPRY